jgi:hypothetical protein
MRARHLPWFLLFALGVMLATYIGFLFMANPGARMPPAPSGSTDVRVPTSTPDGLPSP